MFEKNIIPLLKTAVELLPCRNTGIKEKLRKVIEIYLQLIPTIAQKLLTMSHNISGGWIGNTASENAIHSGETQQSQITHDFTHKPAGVTILSMLFQWMTLALPGDYEPKHTAISLHGVFRKTESIW